MKFTEPVLEIIALSADDVIVTSGECGERDPSGAIITDWM